VLVNILRLQTESLHNARSVSFNENVCTRYDLLKHELSYLLVFEVERQSRRIQGGVVIHEVVLNVDSLCAVLFKHFAR
jgi:hypothetical protein